MKHTILFVSAILFFCFSASAHIHHHCDCHKCDTNGVKGEGDLGFYYTPLISQPSLGAAIDVKFLVAPKLFSGLSLAASGTNIGNTFNYTIGSPRINYYEIGWLNTYDVYSKKNLLVNAELNNAFAGASLADNDQKEEYYSRYGKSYRAKVIARNYYYVLEPGIAAALKLGEDKCKQDYYLIAKARYRFAFGDSRFASAQGFSGMSLSIGIAIRGI